MKSTTETAVGEWERCKRTGSNWRCPERVVPGKTYCEKHHKYIMSRRKGPRRITFSGGGDDNSSGKCDSPSASVSAAFVEPYRPVIDFGAAEDGGGGGFDNNNFVEEGELMGWFMGNDRFALTEPGVGGGFLGGFGGVSGNDGFALGEMSNVGGNDGSAPGEMARVEGQNGEVGRDENVIVIAMEANSSLGKGQKRKRGRFFGS